MIHAGDCLEALARVRQVLASRGSAPGVPAVTTPGNFRYQLQLLLGHLERLILRSVLHILGHRIADVRMLVVFADLANAESWLVEGRARRLWLSSGTNNETHNLALSHLAPLQFVLFQFCAGRAHVGAR